MVICLERGADLHVAQLVPLPLAVSCFSKIQIGFSSLVPAHLGSPGERAVKRVCVFVASPNFTKLLVTLSVSCVFIDDVSVTLLIICGNRWRFCAAVGAYFAVS